MAVLCGDGVEASPALLFEVLGAVSAVGGEGQV